MTREHAHRLLDAARRGENLSAALITEALRATGDLAPRPIFCRVIGEPPDLPSQWLPPDPVRFRQPWQLPEVA